MTQIDTSTEAVEALLKDVTPGPWKSDSEFCEANHKVRVAMPDLVGVPQATISECYHNWNDAYCGERRISWKEAEANASFIAAARDLVPAIRAALTEAEACNRGLVRLNEAMQASVEELKAEVKRLKAQAVTADLEAVVRAMWPINCADSTYDEAVKAAQRGSAIDGSAVLFMQELAKAAISAITTRSEDEVWNEAVEAAADEVAVEALASESSPTVDAVMCAIRTLKRPVKGEK